MRPTSVANNVIAEVRESLHQLQTCLVQSRQFDPMSSRKHFTLSLHSALEASYLPNVIKNVTSCAPSLVISSKRRVRRSELETKLASGDIDLAIDTLVPVNDNIKHTPIQQNKLVVLARKTHPNIKKALTLETYLQQQHVMVSSRSTGQSLEDFELGRLNLHRDIALRCQHIFSACLVVKDTDMLLTLTESNGRIYSDLLGLQMFDMPAELPPIDVHLYWHANLDLDPANRWLRERLINAAKDN